MCMTSLRNEWEFFTHGAVRGIPELNIPFYSCRKSQCHKSSRANDEGPMLETLDYTIHIGSTPTFLYFDLYLYSAYAAHFVYCTLTRLFLKAARLLLNRRISILLKWKTRLLSLWLRRSLNLWLITLLHRLSSRITGGWWRRIANLLWRRMRLWRLRWLAFEDGSPARGWLSFSIIEGLISQINRGQIQYR